MVRFNPALASVAELGLERLEGTLTVANQRTLEALELAALADVRALAVHGNDALTTIGLDALDRVQSARAWSTTPCCRTAPWRRCSIRVQPGEVECGGNWIDECTAWCTEEAV